MYVMYMYVYTSFISCIYAYSCTYTCSIHTASVALTSRDKHSVASSDVTLVTLGHLVSEEYLTLIGGHDPLLVLQEVLLRRRNEVEDLLPLGHAKQQHNTT